MAALDTLLDLNRQVIAATLQADTKLPSGASFGGLHGGYARLTGRTAVLTRLSFVPGVQLSGTLPACATAGCSERDDPRSPARAARAARSASARPPAPRQRHARRPELRPQRSRRSAPRGRGASAWPGPRRRALARLGREPAAAAPRSRGYAERVANALAQETSPYLLQHAREPRRLASLGRAGVRAGRERDVPVLVSIGYSSCHWCHVMERESFEDARRRR